jgi:hypothetical protein
VLVSNKGSSDHYKRSYEQNSHITGDKYGKNILEGETRQSECGGNKFSPINISEEN